MVSKRGVDASYPKSSVKSYLVKQHFATIRGLRQSSARRKVPWVKGLRPPAGWGPSGPALGPPLQAITSRITSPPTSVRRKLRPLCR